MFVLVFLWEHIYEKMSGSEGWYKKPNTIELWLTFVMMIVHDSIMILHYVIIILHNVMMIVHDITMILHYVMMMLHNVTMYDGTSLC